MKELRLTDKDILRNKLKSQVKSFQFLVLPFLLLVGLSYFAFRQHWVTETFPAYLALLGLVLLFTLLVFLTGIIRTRKAISSSAKAIVTGKITKKFSSSDEFYTGLYFEIQGEKYEVDSDQFDAFKEGDRVKLEFSDPGKELFRIKPIKPDSRIHRAYRKARISARKLRR